MKKNLLLFTLFISLIAICQSAFAQEKKDSVTYLPDSVNTISVRDIVSTLKNLEDKVTKKDYDMYERAYIILLQLTEQKRKRVIKK